MTTLPLLGREAELAFVARALEGPGAIVSGPAGVGKSRLVSEAVARAGRPVFSVVATTAAGTIPFGAFSGLLTVDVMANASSRLELMVRLADRLAEHAAAGVVSIDDAHLLDDASAALLHRLVLERRVVAVLTVRTGEAASDAVTSLWKEGVLDRFELQPLADRSFPVGLGISTQYLTWDYDSEQFVFQVAEFSNATELGSLVTAPADLTSATTVASLDPSHFNSPRGIGYLGGGLVAATNAGSPRGVGIVDLADSSEAGHFTTSVRPYAVAPLPDGNLALRVRGTPNVRVFDRSGTPQTGITLSSDPCGEVVFFACGALTVFDDGHGPELFTGTTFFGLDGALHERVSTTTLDVLDVQGAAYVTSGPWAGKFAVMESQTSTIVIFARS